MLIKGTVTGTATDNKGNFSLKVNKNSALIFLFLVWKRKQFLSNLKNLSKW